MDKNTTQLPIPVRRALEANPALKPYLWQRGLSLYYTGEYEKAAAQFRQDVAVNPNDTEEAIWAYLAESQLIGTEKAREQLLQVSYCLILSE